jgi:hypothetical protein
MIYSFTVLSFPTSESTEFTVYPFLPLQKNALKKKKINQPFKTASLEIYSVSDTIFEYCGV